MKARIKSLSLVKFTTMKLFVFLLTVMFYLPLSAQYKTSAYTMGVKQVILKELKNNNGVLSENIQKRFPITLSNGQYSISLLAKINTSFCNSYFLNTLASIPLPITIK